MATAKQIKLKARLRRFRVYKMKQATGKTNKELGKELGISESQVNHLCRRVRYELEGRNIIEERKERQFQYLLRKLLPIKNQIEGLISED